MPVPLLTSAQREIIRDALGEFATRYGTRPNDPHTFPLCQSARRVIEQQPTIDNDPAPRNAENLEKLAKHFEECARKHKETTALLNVNSITLEDRQSTAFERGIETGAEITYIAAAAMLRSAIRQL